MHALNSTQIVFADKKNFNQLENTGSRDKSFTFEVVNLMYRDMIFAPSINLTSITVSLSLIKKFAIVLLLF